MRFGCALGFLFRVFDEAFFQWKEGHLDAHVWHGFDSPMADMLAYPGVRDWWSSRSHWYSMPFQDHIRSKIVEAGAPAMYGETSAQ